MPFTTSLPPPAAKAFPYTVHLSPVLPLSTKHTLHRAHKSFQDPGIGMPQEADSSDVAEEAQGDSTGPRGQYMHLKTT